MRELMKPKVVIPEVVEPDSALPPDLVALRRFAILLDQAFTIPGTRRKFGLDAAVGLIPGVGDAIGALMSLWIVAGALRHRVPALKVARMLLNIFIDMTIGAIPIIGDIFDFLFSENVGNVEILVRHRDRTRPPRSFVSIAFTIAMIVAAALSIAVLILIFLIWGIYQLAEMRF